MTDECLPSPASQSFQLRRSMSEVQTSRYSPSFVCKSCHALVASGHFLLSKQGFRGYSGKAGLFASVTNATLNTPSIMLMDTGAHTIQELACTSCSSYIGWKILRAYESPERWKEGHYFLELALLVETPPHSVVTTEMLEPESGYASAHDRQPDEGGAPRDAYQLSSKTPLGHRRMTTDPHTLRGRPHGPRSLTPSLRGQGRTLSMLAET